MKRFKFNLESVLAFRQKTLDDERKKLALILNSLKEQENILEEKINALKILKENSEKYFQNGLIDANLISNYSNFVFKSTQEIEAQKQIIEKINLEFKKQQEQVKNAYINSKSLEKLKEKKKEQYNKEFLDEEIKIIDDIVNSRRSIA